MIPILLLHGALGAESQLNELAGILRNKNHQVFTLNFSGHGGKPFSANGFGIEIFANDVVQFLDQQGIEKVDIFGYSMGGYVAMFLALKNPNLVNKIITLGTKFDWDPESAEKEVRKLNPDKILEKIPAFARLLEHRHAPNDWKELMDKTANIMIGLGAKTLLTKDKVKTISNDVIILLGDHDDMADKEYSIQVAEWLPQGKFFLLPETFHPIEIVKPELLVNFLN
jgi:pimeloyl-ACP methyl ester carboxylesterase